jgi:hypothetical protein
METPLGLTYRPVFPILQSIYKQAAQRRQLEEKQVAEATKTAETRAYNAVADYAKFHPDRPYVHALEPYFQTQAKQAFDILNAVKKKEAPPEALYEQMTRMNADADKAKRYDAEVTTFMTKWKDSGNYDMQHILQKYANHTVDLMSTQELGTVAMLPPSATDPNNFVNDTLLDVQSFNKAALSEKFITALKKTQEMQTSEYDPAGNVISKTTSLPDQFFSKELGSSGQHVLNMGPINGDQAKVLLNRFRSMGTDWDNYLQLRSSVENPDFKTMEKGGEEWGVQMQKTLQNLMMENGHIGKKQTETALRPLSETDKAGTSFNANYIGNSRKAEQEAIDAAKVLNRLMKGDKSALAFFKGPNVEVAEFSPDGSSMVFKMKEGKVDQLAQVFANIQGADIDKQAGTATVPLTREALVQMVNFKNAVSSRADWIGENVEKAYDKTFPEGKQTGGAKGSAPETETQKKERGLKELLAPKDNAVDLSDAPSQKDIDEFIKAAPVGTKYKLKDGTIKTKK